MSPPVSHKKKHHTSVLGASLESTFTGTSGAAIDSEFTGTSRVSVDTLVVSVEESCFEASSAAAFRAFFLLHPMPTYTCPSNSTKKYKSVNVDHPNKENNYLEQ